MHTYTAYGLSIRSHFPVPELPALETAPAHADLCLRVDEVDAETGMSGEEQTAFRVTDEHLCLRFPDLGAFLIEADRITVDPAPGASMEAVRLMLVGSVLGLFLRRRGLLTLHGNAVASRDGAAIFLGASGAGKSTLTAALHRRGFCFMSDDVAALDLSGPVVTLRPGLPRLKLWRDAAEAFDRPTGGLPRAHPGFDKHIHPVETRVAVRARRLLAVYVLEPGEAPSLAPLAPADALVELIRHAHLPRSLRITGDEARHFEQSAALARRIPARRLVRGASFDQLPRLLDLIEDDLRHAVRR
ncbi:serine kinase [Rhodocaloribacter sp.]